jgi:methyl-accepting chemotaxis protein
MGIRLKFNLVLLAVFLTGLLGAGYISYGLLQKNARDEVLHSAGLIMESAFSARGYTTERITPHLRGSEEFLPESVPAFAATTIMRSLQEKYPDYWYKEAALNPTNPVNRAVEWEADVINSFRNDPALKELVGMRETPTGQALYLAKPFRITNEACLTCHSVPEAAPVAMIKRYGDKNGFGWQLNEAVGMRVVSVPMAVPIRNANQAFLTFMGLLTAVFVALFIILNLMMSRMLVRPITLMSQAVDRISTGDLSIPEFKESGKDEMALLARSFNRMRRSLDKAIKLIDKE